jgi:hypothetical protein
MGIYKVDKCIFTNLPVENFESSFDAIEYHLTIGKNIFFFRLPYYSTEWEKNNEFFKNNKYIFHSLLLNNKWFENQMNFIDIKDLEKFLTEVDYPKTHYQKLENLFIQLLKLQKEEGQTVVIENILWVNNGCRFLFYKSENECLFYINHLESEGLILCNKSLYDTGLKPISFNITFKGLSHSIKIQNEGEKSKKCFVAMSFNPEMIEIRNAIKKAII